MRVAERTGRLARLIAGMATHADFVEHVRNQFGDELSYRKMFGEYALYLDGKVVAFACDNQLYVKPTEPGRDLLRNLSEHPPYPGAKLYYRVDAEIDDRDLLRRLLMATAQALPLPKPKPKKPKALGRAAPWAAGR